MDSQSKAYELTKQITENYEKEILPYEIVAESIALQNREIYELEKQYIEMKAQVEKLAEPSESEQQIFNNRMKQRVIQRKLFAEEALIANENKYQEGARRKRKQLQEQIQLLQEQIEMQREGEVNIFMNLGEGLLGQLLEQNRKNEQISGAIRYWKQVYERSKKTDS